VILNIENNEFIQKVKDFISNNETTGFWDDLSLSEQKEIREGIKSLDRGERISYNEFLKKVS
jgi:hypothetical protein